jgi:SAM-dependent methyltransferase
MKPDGTFESQEYKSYLDGGVSWRYFKDTLALCIREANPGRFLDVGSGLGFFVECSRLYGIACDGVEGSEFAVEQAAERGVPLVLYDLRAASPFPFPSEHSSLVLLSQIVEHLPRDTVSHLLCETRRCLEPGGTVVILTPSLYNPRERNKPGHINLYTPSAIKQQVEECGLEFRHFLNNWPRHVLTGTRAEFFFWRQVCRFARPDWLSGGASCVAVKHG